MGVGLFSELFLGLDRSILNKGHFGEITLPQWLKVNHWLVIFPLAIGIIGLLFLIERSGL